MLKINSNEIDQGDTFLCLPGEEENIKKAINNGAACVITDHGEYEVKTIIVNDTVTYLSNYLKELYFEKLDKIKIIGVVGSTGKTSVEILITQLLNNLGKKTAYLEKDKFIIGEKSYHINANIYNTYELINKAIDNNCENIVIELSSDSITKRIFEGLRFDIILLTNLLTNDSNYINTILEPFKMIKNNGYAIINKNNPNSEMFVLPQNKNILYAYENSDYIIKDIFLSYDSLIFNINNKKIELPIIGSYNAYNFLSAYMVVKSLSYTDEEIIEIANRIQPVEGHYQNIKYEDNLIIIDNANNVEKMKNVIKYTKEFIKGKLITIKGLDYKEKEKNEEIKNLLKQTSDYTIFTMKYQTYEEIEKPDINNEDNAEFIVSRKDAIKKGINMLKEKDILLIFGEDKEIMQNEEYSDYKEIIKNIKGRRK